MNTHIRTVYIFEATDETRQKETALKNVNEHPLGLANVCFHRYGHSCNENCYTLDAKAGGTDKEELDTKV